MTKKDLRKEIVRALEGKNQICMCGHLIDNHLEQINGIAIAGQCLKCDCNYYCKEKAD